jgi:hypothetical protein
VCLQIVCQRQVVNQAVLRLQPVDGFFAVLQQVFQQVAADVVLQLFTQCNTLDQQRALELALVLEVALQTLDDVFANQQLAQALQVGQPLEKRTRSISLSASFMTRMDCL